MALVLKHFTAAAQAYHTNARFQKKKQDGTPAERPEALARLAYSSRDIYIGNLAFVTTEAQIFALFSRCGAIDKIIMGLNKITRKPCGFAFVQYKKRESALEAVEMLNGTILDERVVKVELDKGFHEGRQYGKAESGGQVRDEVRAIQDVDEGRGGSGKGHASFLSRASDPGPGYHGRAEGQGRRPSYGGGHRQGQEEYSAGGRGQRRFDPREGQYGHGGGGRGGYQGGHPRGRGGGGGGGGGYGGAQGRDNRGPAAGFGGPAGAHYSGGQKRRREDTDAGADVRDREGGGEESRDREEDEENYRRTRRRDDEGDDDAARNRE